MDNKSKGISGNGGGSGEIIDQPISPTGGSEGKGIPSPESTGSSAVGGIFKNKTKRRSQVWRAQPYFTLMEGSRKHLCTFDVPSDAVQTHDVYILLPFVEKIKGFSIQHF
jgi:hypothetical protein